MKRYTKPNMEISKFAVESIITASGMVVNSDTLVGADKDMYEVYTDNSVAQNKKVSVFTW